LRGRIHEVKPPADIDLPSLLIFRIRVLLFGGVAVDFDNEAAFLPTSGRKKQSHSDTINIACAQVKVFGDCGDTSTFSGGAVSASSSGGLRS
jgi:hypothetical protein